MPQIRSSTPSCASGPRRATRLTAGLAMAALAPLLIVAATTAHADDTPVDLATAKAFSVLAGSGVTNTGITRLQGSLGTHETPTVTTDKPFVFTGAGAKNHAGDAVTQKAKSDLLNAYDTVAGAQPPTAIPQELTRDDPYLPGIYRASSSLLLSGAMTLDGGGRKDGVFIFQAPASTLTTASNSTVLFVNGAQPCNVYWQVGSSATFGTGTTFVGNVLAHTSISATTNATFKGRLLANFGAVTLDSNTITNPACDTSGGGGTDTEGTTTEGAGTEGTTTEGAGTEGTTTEGAGTEGATTEGTNGQSVSGVGVQSATDSQIGTNSQVGTNTDSTGTGTETDTDLPGTGAPSLVPLGLGVVAVIGGVVLIRRHRTH